MNRDVFVVVYLVVMGAIIVLGDVLFLREHFWWRLAYNVAVVVVFLLVYLLVLRKSLP